MTDKLSKKLNKKSNNTYFKYSDRLVFGNKWEKKELNKLKPEKRVHTYINRAWSQTASGNIGYNKTHNYW